MELSDRIGAAALKLETLQDGASDFHHETPVILRNIADFLDNELKDLISELNEISEEVAELEERLEELEEE